MVRYFSLCLLLCSFAGCAPSLKDEVGSAALASLSVEELQEGQRVLRLYCGTCHGVGDNAEADMLAPSLWGVRQHYLREYPQPEAFAAEMLDFLYEPHETKSVMPLAVEQYGVMGALPMDAKSLELAVRMIAADQVERPVWARDYDKAHAECYQAAAE